MIEALFDRLIGNMISSVGSPALAVLILMGLFFLVLLYCNLEFDYALVILAPIPYAFYKAGYLDVWVASIFIIIPLGIGIFNIWNRLSQR